MNISTMGKSMMTSIHLDQSLVRLSNALLWAAVVTFGLLMLMQFLIETEFDEPEIAPPPYFGDVFSEIKPTPPQPKDRTKEIDKPLDPPALPSADATIDAEGDMGIRIDPYKSDSGNRGFGDMVLGDGSPIRLVTPAPVYPLRATEKGIEGFVDIQFDIGTSGATSNLQILTYQPSTIFNRSVLQAVAKWRYRPKIVDGTVVAVVGVVERVSFELEK